jgi:hypothetical protein
MRYRLTSMEKSQSWYIVKGSAGICDILSNDRLATQNDAKIVECWGPFASAQDAIARRVGLIRAGKCQPR